jgi:hypothetical protein
MSDDKPHVVMPLLALAVVANLFLFSVAYTNASFNGTERALPNVFAPSQISQTLDNGLTVIAENLTWSVSTAVAEVKPMAVSFFGLEDYKFGNPRYTALNTNHSNVDEAHTGAVLGASIVNPEYAGELPSIPTPRLLSSYFQ